LNSDSNIEIEQSVTKGTCTFL